MQENEKNEKDKKYYEEQSNIEKETEQKEKMRKKLQEEEEEIQNEFSNKVGQDLAQSKKLIGFIKRYVLIGTLTGVPGIALTYLWDRWQENKIVKELYDKNIQSIVNPNDRELAKEYEILRRKFYKAYDIDKIEKLLMSSDEITKLKTDKKAIENLTEEIRKCRELYKKNIDTYIENKIISENDDVVLDEQDEEELEIENKKIIK